MRCEIGFALGLWQRGQDLGAPALQIGQGTRLFRRWMWVREDAITTEHVPPAERLRGRFLEVFAHRLTSVRNDIPGLWHPISWIVRPGRALQVVARCQIFCRACAERRPAALLFCGALRHADRIVKEALTALDVIQKESIHEIAHGHTKSLLA